MYSGSSLDAIGIHVFYKGNLMNVPQQVPI